MSLVRYYRQYGHISLKTTRLVINFNLKSITRIILFSPILTDHMRFPTYVKGGSASHIRFRCVQMNALFRNIIHAEANTLEQGNILFTEGINECAGWHLNGDLMT